jgi:6-pyruvoyltetrahydropterin/6-carboxytetrahydropterin synthase
MKFTLKKEFRFEAAHKLPLHDGKCQRLHGHSWKMRVVVSGELLAQGGPKSGMLQDYAEISQKVKPIVDNLLDHHYLNETLKMESPTSENIACWLYFRLKDELPGLVAVEIDETCTSSCCFQP